jgi:hypothetical protein
MGFPLLLKKEIKCLNYSLKLYMYFAYVYRLCLLILQKLSLKSNEKFVIATTNREEIKDDESWGKLIIVLFYHYFCKSAIVIGQS